MQYTPPNVTRLTDLFSSVSIGQGFSTFFGGSSAKLLNNGSYVYLALDKSTGSGLASKNKYYYGFFSAAIRLPAGLSSGVVVALSSVLKEVHLLAELGCICLWERKFSIVYEGTEA
ncbi:hypothetical protein GH714_027659 [Hevea brasiliensis]|uniref:GH16 domain-containing protein n=1 Tax=Hevea brasiliensis TaxID=3981 RepID=A0A6A6KXE7_HEVBR|nr:hypothetical protein GH714_027659 [Hevea brasiliensis]